MYTTMVLGSGSTNMALVRATRTVFGCNYLYNIAVLDWVMYVAPR